MRHQTIDLKLPDVEMFMSRGDAAFRRKSLHDPVMKNSLSGAHSFMHRKYKCDFEGVDLAVTGIPFDQAVSNRPGARFGPEAVRRAAARQAWGPVMVHIIGG